MTSPSVTAGEAAAGERAAIAAGAVCYFFWGFLALLFKAAAWAGATAMEIVVWRAVWSLVAAGALIVLTRQTPALARVFASPKTLAWLLVSALLIGGNWSLFVWSVNAGHTLDASLAYYLTPLFNIAAGMLLFRERIGPVGWAAIGLAALGVGAETVAHGTLPLVALGMAASFGLYGIVRKRVEVDAQTGLFVECLILSVPALAAGVWLQSSGQGHAAQPLAGSLLVLCGPATAAPLIVFAWAVRRMPMSTLGFLQFIAPTVQFFIGLASGERLSTLGLVGFGFIWAGVIVYAVTVWRVARRYRGQVSGEAARTSPAR